MFCLLPRRKSFILEAALARMSISELPSDEFKGIAALSHMRSRSESQYQHVCFIACPLAI